MPTEIKTDAKLLAALRALAGRAQTPDEVRAQRVSWIMGIVPPESHVTRARAEEIVDHLYGGQKQAG